MKGDHRLKANLIHDAHVWIEASTMHQALYYPCLAAPVPVSIAGCTALASHDTWTACNETRSFIDKDFLAAIMRADPTLTTIVRANPTCETLGGTKTPGGDKV